MAIIAEEVSGKNQYGSWPKRVKRCADGWHGTKYFIVNTEDPLAALDAQNLPRYGTSWNGARNLFRCYDIEAVYKCGTNDPNQESGGWCEVTASFREPGDGRPLAFPGSSYTEMGTRLANVRQVYDIRRNPNQVPGGQGDLDLQIENGRGTTREYAFTTATVRIFPTNQSAQSILQRQDRARDLVNRQVVSEDNLFLPNIIGTGQSYTVEPQTARLHLQSHGIDAGYHFFDFEFLLGPSAAFWKWFAIDARKAAFRQISSQQYQIETIFDLIAP